MQNVGLRLLPQWFELTINLQELLLVMGWIRSKPRSSTLTLTKACLNWHEPETGTVLHLMVLERYLLNEILLRPTSIQKKLLLYVSLSFSVHLHLDPSLSLSDNGTTCYSSMHRRHDWALCHHHDAIPASFRRGMPTYRLPPQPSAAA